MDEQLIRDLLNKLGFFIKQVTNRKIILVGESVIQKQTEPYVMIEEALVGDPNWHTNEVYDPETGNMVNAYSSTVDFIITTAKDDTSDVPVETRRTAFNDARKIKHAFHLPYINYEYFKDDRFAFASCTDPTKQRVPLDQQTFENRCRMVVTFNVCFVDSDFGAFELVERIRTTSNIQTPTDTIVNISDTTFIPNP